MSEEVDKRLVKFTDGKCSLANTDSADGPDASVSQARGSYGYHDPWHWQLRVVPVR
jgi:hypothetical protein